MFTSVGTFAGDWDRSFLDEDRRTEAVVVGTVSQPSSEMMVRLFADRSRLTRAWACGRLFCPPRPVSNDGVHSRARRLSRGRGDGVAAAWRRAGGVAATRCRVDGVGGVGS